MPRPNIFISHRWEYSDDYDNLVDRFRDNGFNFFDFSVPDHDPLDAHRVREIEAGLAAQVVRCNYFLIFARLASTNSRWCKFEVKTAVAYEKPILGVRPFDYHGGIPQFITAADNQGGPFVQAPAIVTRIRKTLDWWE